MNVPTIFVPDAITLTGAVTARLMPNAAKKPKFYVQLTDEAVPPLDVTICDEAAKTKFFKDATAVAKFVAPYCETGVPISVEVSADDYVKEATAGDPTKTLASAIAKVTKEIAKLAAIIGGLTTSIDAATALGWATGSAAQRYKLEDDTARKAMVTALKVTMDAKLTALQAQAAP